MQPWILFTNYQRYVEEFVRWAAEGVRNGPGRDGRSHARAACASRRAIRTPEAKALDAPWRKYQMPAYHLTTPEGDGVTLVNIGVGPSNAKTITDHLAVLRPHCWMMVGHCGGLRHTQRIGDYVARGTLICVATRSSTITCRSKVPIPAIAEISGRAAAGGGRRFGRRSEPNSAVVCGPERSSPTPTAIGSFATCRSANCSLNRALSPWIWKAPASPRRAFAFACPMACCCACPTSRSMVRSSSPGVADRFYETAIAAHLRIGLEAIAILKQNRDRLHSRKLRAFDEPPFR